MPVPLGGNLRWTCTDAEDAGGLQRERPLPAKAFKIVPRNRVSVIAAKAASPPQGARHLLMLVPHDRSPGLSPALPWHLYFPDFGHVLFAGVSRTCGRGKGSR